MASLIANEMSGSLFWVNARASYQREGPYLIWLFLMVRMLNQHQNPSLLEGNFVELFRPDEKQWKLHLLKAYHPLLLQRHHDKLQEAKKAVAWATSMGVEVSNLTVNSGRETEGKVVDLRILQEKVTRLERAHPAPVDFAIDKGTRVIKWS